MFRSLALIRGNSAAIAPINLLPPEVLAHIFALLVPCCMLSRATLNEFYDPAAVCAYWRQVAINTKRLWTHIDIGPNTPNGLTDLLFKRTRGSSIEVHVYEPHSRQTSTILMEGTAKVVNMLTPHIHRVRALDIEVYNDGSELISSVVNLWLDHGNPNLARSLDLGNFSTYWPQAPDGQNHDKPEITQSENAGRMLRSLNSLRLYNTYLSWHSSVFHDLVDLQLFFNTSGITVSTQQLANILSASPALVTLTLRDLEIVLGDREQPVPVPMKCLKVLDLADLHCDSQELLLPLIDLSSSIPDIIASVRVGQLPQNGLEAFLGRSRIRSLYCWGSSASLVSLRPFLLRPRSHASTLIFYNFKVDKVNGTRASPLFSRAHPLSFPPDVVFESCEISLEGLVSLVAEHGVHQLEVEKCSVRAGSDSSLDGISSSLIEMFPAVQCTIIGEGAGPETRYDKLFGFPI